MTLQINIFGAVQGVGFRPYVARLAEELGVTGMVRNSGGMVQITACASQKAMDEWIRRLSFHPPAGASILKLETKVLPDQNFEGFCIVESGAGTPSERLPVFPPDLPTCGDCLREMQDEKNRRFRYPFISCVSCGPRYSILKKLPYDRENTSMDGFQMCAPCQEEYAGGGRRRHAQTISCHDCGPQLLWKHGGESCQKEEAYQRAVSLLKSGGVLALKGIGGYQFACSPSCKNAVQNLRVLKGREKKPFAVMFPTLEEIRELCDTSPEEESLLQSTARPIVLLKKRGEPFCPEVSGESRFLGAFLPYTPLHHMLTADCGPLVMTSGNRSSDPIITGDSDLTALDSPMLGGVLSHKREILSPLDDSVARVAGKNVQIMRRARGYTPLPIFLKEMGQAPVLAMGGDLKAAFCLLQNGMAYPSQYLGDLANYNAFKNYRRELTRMQDIFGFHPEAIACDLHPGYFSSRHAETLASGKRLLKIQHHHAHIGSVMAEHGLASCIGVAFDGTGYGLDGGVWGGEFFVCRGAEFERRASLSPITLCGGDESSRDASLCAACHLISAGALKTDGKYSCGEDRLALITAALEHRVNTAESTSMGRLFDAVSAILGIRGYNTYEGECAIALENTAAQAMDAGLQPYPLHMAILKNSNILRLDCGGLIRNLTSALHSGADIRSLALGFHEAVAEAVAGVCAFLREQTGESKAALSGGVFANLILTELCRDKLQAAGFLPYFNSAVPCNDGGISLGQAYLAAQILQGGL